MRQIEWTVLRSIEVNWGFCIDSRDFDWIDGGDPMQIEYGRKAKDVLLFKLSSNCFRRERLLLLLDIFYLFSSQNSIYLLGLQVSLLCTYQYLRG